MIRASTKLAQNYKKKQTELHILKIEKFSLLIQNLWIWQVILGVEFNWQGSDTKGATRSCKKIN